MNTIHYIWISANENSKIPEDQQKMIDQVMKVNSEFEFKIWKNEDISKLNIENAYYKKAIKEKSWAFASDYLRAKILYEHGGIYIDTDFFAQKKIINFQKYESFPPFEILIGFEYKFLVSTGFIWVKNKNNNFIKRLLKYYDSFDNVDYKKIKFLVNNYIFTTILLKEYSLKLSGKNQFLKDKVLIVSYHYFASNFIVFDETYFLHKHQLSWKDNNFSKAFMTKALNFVQNHKFMTPFLYIEIKIKLRKFNKIYKKLRKNERNKN